MPPDHQRHSFRHPQVWNGSPLGHGTFIAGLIGADPDNGILGKGIAPEAILTSYKLDLVPCRDDHRTACFDSISQRLVALKNYVGSGSSNRTVIVNMSFGEHPSVCPPIYATLTNLLKEYPNVVLVASAGNAKKDLAVEPHYPSGCDGVLEVAASNHLGALATGWWNKDDNSFTAGSNYGPDVVVAPGDMLTSLKPGGGAKLGGGTSYAAPLVAGIAAHLKAWFPEASGFQIIEAIQQSSSHGSSPHQKWGYGFVRPLEAIKYLDDLFDKDVYCQLEPGGQGCETIDPPEPEFHVRLEVGNSAEGAITESGLPCSVRCRYLRVEIDDEAALCRELGPGPYTLVCAHDGVHQTGYARGAWQSVSVSEWPHEGSCFFGFPGNKVFVIVGAELREGFWHGGTYSKDVVWPNCTVEPDRSNPDRCPNSINGGGPELSVRRGSVRTDNDTCPASAGCRWVVGSGSGWPAGEQFWIKCGNFVDTSRNIGANYRDRFVESSGNLSWGEAICYSAGSHTVEVWTQSGARKTVTVQAAEAPPPSDPDPTLVVRRGSVRTDNDTCPASAGCRWVVGSGSGWPAGEQFWIKCGNFVDTSRNIGANYRDRFVESSGNLSWGEAICYSAGSHTVEVWTQSGARKTVTIPG